MKKFLSALLLVVLAGLLCTLGISTGSSTAKNLEPAVREAAVGQLNIHVLDVGQGDSLLIVSPTGKRVLVDAGPSAAGDTVVRELRENGVRSLDLVVASHPHEDHIGGMVPVLEAFEVKNFLDSGRAYTTATFRRMLEKIDEKNINFIKARRGQTFDLGGGAKIEVLRPTSRWITRVRSGGSLENANSVVCRLTYRNFAMLFTGDAEMDTEYLLVREGADLEADVLKVGHHGSRHATGPDFLNAVHPKVAVISNSADNEYGHPTQTTLDRLRQWGVRVYRTDLHGEITITPTNFGITPFTVRTERRAPVEAIFRGNG